MVHDNNTVSCTGNWLYTGIIGLLCVQTNLLLTPTRRAFMLRMK